MHKNNAKLTTAAVSTGTPSTDSDDVYIRIGGATLSSMLHNRYKDIRKCHNEERRDILSQEIQILQAQKISQTCPSTYSIATEGICTCQMELLFHFFDALMSV